MENQTQVVDKRTKEYKAQVQTKSQSTDLTSAIYDRVKQDGIPTRTAVFARAVNYPNLEPVTAFYSEDPAVKPYKKANMWLTPYGLICEQKDKRMIVPLANVLFTLPL